MSLHNKFVFSKLDSQRAYLQIPVRESDIPKTAVTTPFGLFEYRFMPYELKEASSTFQRFMDTIFANVKNTVVYLDDVLVASNNVEEHKRDIDNVLSILSFHDLKLTVSKCEFFKPSLTFLGYQISGDGIRPPQERIQAISDIKLPNNSTELRRFTGMLNFFRHMVPNFANIAFPVTELLRTNPKSKELKWTDSARDFFQQLKQALSQCPTLSYPSNKMSDYQLVTDCSNHAAGAALYQLIDGQPYPVSFFSKKLTQEQQSYSTYDRELIAAFLSVRQFKTLIDGHRVTLFSDHKPLVSAFYSKNSSHSDRQRRHLSFLSEYISDMQYVRGQNNIVDDFFSRPINAITADTFDLSGLAFCQQQDEEIESYKDRLSCFPLNSDLVLWCDLSTPTPRPFVPQKLRTKVIAFLHSLSHPSVKSTTKIVKQRYYWPNIDKDIKLFVHSCVDCQRAKIGRHTHLPISLISSPKDRFKTVHIDIITLPTAQVSSMPNLYPFRYVLTCIDRATRWCEAIPLIDITVSTVAVAFLSGWISRFGVPLLLVTDRGTQFESEVFQELSRLIGFHHIGTTSYHSQSNGFVERLHRTLKSALIARGTDWYLSLPIVLMGLRMSPNSLDYSPFTAVTGTYMLCPHPIITNDNKLDTTSATVQHFMKEMQSINFHDFSYGTCNSNSTSYIPKDLFTVPSVWLRVDRVRKPLEAPYSGPFDVLERHSKHFILRLPQGDTSVSIDRLKPAHLSSPIIKPSNILPLSETPITQKPKHVSIKNSSNPSTSISASSSEKTPIVTRSGR